MSYNKSTAPDRTIIGTLIVFEGLISKIFGDYTPKVILKDDIENNKNLLSQIYGITDVNYIFPSMIDFNKFRKTLNTIFKFAPMTQDGSSDTK